MSSPTAAVHKPMFVDRKATLPRRILKLCLRLASLAPGRYVLVVEVPAEGELRFEEASLQGYRQGA
jgi:hypothetical protein